MSLLDVRNAIVATLTAKLGPNVSVQPHRGRFDNAQEIQRFATKAPAVLVAALRVQRADDMGGISRLPVQWGIFVITKDEPKLPRDQGAIGLVETILMLTPDNDWGAQSVGAVSNLDARNLYAQQVDSLGIALWGIGFEQPIEEPLLSDAEYAALNPFLTFHQDIDMAPADGVIDITETDTLPQ
jgi:hypothetical protein